MGAKRESFEEGVNYIKWTFQPVQARNAFLIWSDWARRFVFTSRIFYGTDYSTSPEQDSVRGVDSDRLFRRLAFGFAESRRAFQR
jgi:predicted GNAT superfamily acetyltransferase